MNWEINKTSKLNGYDEQFEFTRDMGT